MAWIFGAVALLLVVIAAGLTVHTAVFLSGAVSTTGTVTGFNSSEKCKTETGDHGGSYTRCRTVYAPRVLFTTASGQEIEYQSRAATNPPRYHEGEQVEIRYDTDDPQKARIHAYVDLWLAPTIVGGIGGIFGVIAGVLAVIARGLRNKPKPTPSTRRH